MTAMQNLLLLATRSSATRLKTQLPHHVTSAAPVSTTNEEEQDELDQSVVSEARDDVDLD